MKRVILVVLMGVALIMTGLAIHFGVLLNNMALIAVAGIGIIISLFFLSGLTCKK